MTTTKDTGLAAIAQSTRETPAPMPAEEKPPLQLEGRRNNRGIALDAGLWSCAAETADRMTKCMGLAVRERITLRQVLQTAFIKFHDLPFEEQIELVRKHG